MPERVTENRIDELVAKLTEYGGVSGNGRLRAALKWDEDFYWKVQGKLVEDGRVVPGRGRGGSIILAKSSQLEEKTEVENEKSKPTKKRNVVERPLYEPLKNSISSRWIKRFGFDNVEIIETHSAGPRNTGGTFTKPDITAVGIRQYVFLGKRIEVVTFEIKPKETVGIGGVLEALAHKEASHRSYIIYAIARGNFDLEPEAERIFELAQKYGVGIILAEDPTAVETWEILIDALRHEPDPGRLDRFLGDLPDEKTRKQIHKWMA